MVCQTKLNTQNSPSLPKINSIFTYSHLATAIPTRFPTGGPNRSSHLPPGPITWHQRAATKNSTRPGGSQNHWRSKGSKESCLGKPGDSLMKKSCALILVYSIILHISTQSLRVLYLSFLFVEVK